MSCGLSLSILILFCFRDSRLPGVLRPRFFGPRRVPYTSITGVASGMPSGSSGTAGSCSYFRKCSFNECTYFVA